MATLNPDSLFQSWSLSAKEQLHGSIFSDLNHQYLQNYICARAIEKVNLAFLDENKARHIELEAEIKTIQYLLEVSKASQREVLDGARTEY